MACSRRQMLTDLLAAGAAVFAGGLANVLERSPLLRSCHGMGEESKFVIAQVEYRGGNWNPRPQAARRLQWEVIKRTSIEAKLDIVTAKLDDPLIFRYPLLYMAGDEEFEPFTDAEIANLRRFLEFGGLLLADDANGKPDFGFDKTFRREIARVFPDLKLTKLSPTHTVYQSFYLLNQVAGRINANPYMEGITLGDRTVVIYTQNDLGGAWARDNFGNWEYNCTPGGERQRTMAFRLGVNIVMYALTVNYKKDQVHIPHILQRRR